MRKPFLPGVLRATTLAGLMFTCSLMPLTMSSSLPLSASGPGLKAGAAKTCITPPAGSIINGELGPLVAKRIHDDLFVRALVLDDGTRRLAFAIVDTCLLDRPLCDGAKQLIQQQTGIEPSHVLISAVHTHSGGAAAGAHLTEPDEAYRRSMPGHIASAVAEAASRLAPAQAGWGSAPLPEHVFCRRLLVKPGMTYTNQLGQTGDRVKMNWDSPHPADGEPSGPTDPEVSVLSVQHADGRPLALIANYSLHYVGDVVPGDISADYFGAFCKRIADLLGADHSFVGMLTNGTSGDINNWNPETGSKSPAPYSQIEKVSGDVANLTLDIVRKTRHRRDLALRASLRECVVGTRRPTEAEVAKAREFLGGRRLDQLSTWPDNFAREQTLLATYPPEVSLPLQVIHIGELAIAAWPGEIFAASGLELKRHQPLFNIELANGWFGYIPPPSQFPLGAYETWRMRTSYLEVDAIPKMIDCFQDLLK